MPSPAFNRPRQADRVLVTGGTGFTGRCLLKKLCATGCEVRVICRPSSDRSGLDSLPIRWFIGDVFDPDVIREATQGVHYVFHVAGAFRENSIDDDTYEKVNVTSTQLLAESAVNTPDFRHFVHISTIGVNGHIATPPADENAPFNPGDIYQSTKMEGERWIRQFAETTSLPLTIIRPAMIYGPEDRRMLKLFKLAKLPVVPILGFGNGWMHMIHVDDLTDFMLQVVNRDADTPEVFICGNSKPIRFSDAIKAINRKLGRKSLFIRLPAAPFFALGYLCEKICIPLNIEPPIFRRRVAFFTKDRSFNTKKMQQTGFTPRLDGVAGLHQTLDWYRRNQWL